MEIKAESVGEEGGGIGGSDLCCYGDQINEHMRIKSILSGLQLRK